MTDPLLLPQGARVVHIGPHKTGTTALQHALHRSRESLLEQGVQYAGDSSQAYLAAHGLTGQPRPAGVPDATEQDWLDLVAEAQAAGSRRMVISSEAFAAAGPSHVDRLAQDLGRDRVHVVRMVRRYDALLPSQWQQSIRAGGRRPTLDRWVVDLLEDPSHPIWLRHRFAHLTRVWADVVGPENVTVVVVDESDRGWSLRVVERLLGLRTGTLPLVREGENRSASLGEAELLRRFNALRRRESWPPEVHLHYVMRVVLPTLRRLPADPEGGRIELPRECYSALFEATRRDVDELLGLGVRIVGDVGLLDPPASPKVSGSGPAPVATIGAGRAATVVAAAVDRALTGPVRLSAGARARPDERVARPDAVRVGLHLPHRPASAFLSVALGGTALVDDPSTRDDMLDHVLVPVVPAWQIWVGAWQQELLLRRGPSFSDWLGGDAGRWSLADPVSGLVQRFGADRVVLVPVDAHEPEAAVRSMVAAGGPAALTPGAGGEVNRSLLAWPELELVRSLALEGEARGWRDETWVRHVREGAVCRVLTRPPVRRWRAPAVDRDLRRMLETESTRYVGLLQASGAQVAGELAGLDAGFPATRPGEARLASRAAALALAGVVEVSLTGD